MPDGDDRIEHGSLAARERARSAHRLRIGHGVAAADEPLAIGLIGDLLDVRPVHGHQVKHPRGRLVERSGAGDCRGSPAAPDDLGLNEEIAERGMERVRRGGGENDLRVARHLDLSALARAVRDVDAAHLDVILRRDGDLRVRVEVVVAAAELRPRLGEDRFVAFRLLERRLIRGRPELPGAHVADVAERAPVVAGAVLAPAGDGEVLPAAVAASRVRDHHVVSAVRQQLHFRRRGVRRAENAHRGLRAAGGRRGDGELGGLGIEHRGSSAPAPGATGWSPGTTDPTRTASASDDPGSDRRGRAGSFPGDAP